VDDRRDVRGLIRETLAPSGYRVLEASDGREGLEVFEQNAARIDLVITDLTMPRMGGFEFAQLVKQRSPKTKVLFMSGYSRESAAADKPTPLLEKPFTPEALASKVREVLGTESAQRSILVADDDSEIRNLLCAILEGEGYEVHTAINGKKAMALLRETPVSLVLTDLAMPDKDGIEMIREIRQDFPDLKVIAMSGTFSGAVLTTAKHLGANAILAKPLQVEELLQAVQDFI
jgi:CheY-like chemotaxis protein